MILKLTLVVLAVAGTLRTAQAQPGKCNVLVMEGGADLGAYEAGVIKAIVNNLPEQYATWDLFSGISVGAVNSAGLNQFPKGNDGNHEMAAWVEQTWIDTRAYNVYTNWSPGGIVHGILYEKGVFNTTPLFNYMHDKLFTSQKRWLNIGATDVESANLIRFNETLGDEGVIQAVMCSAAVPGLFPWQSFQNKSFFDGGVANGFDVAGAVERCRREGKQDKDIVVDLILVTSNKTLPNWGPNPDKKTYEVYQANRLLSAYEKSFRQYQLARDLYPNVDWRYVIYPSKSLPDAYFPILFNEKLTKQMIQQGYDDALATIQKGHGVQADELYEEAKELLFKRIDPNYMPKEERLRRAKKIVEV